MAAMKSSHPDLATVFVSHHLEELPPSMTHAALLRAGRFVAAGKVHDVLTSELVSQCFGFPITVAEHGSRWTARASASWMTRDQTD